MACSRKVRVDIRSRKLAAEGIAQAEERKGRSSDSQMRVAWGWAWASGYAGVSAAALGESGALSRAVVHRRPK